MEQEPPTPIPFFWQIGVDTINKLVLHVSKLVIWGSSWGRGFRFHWLEVPVRGRRGGLQRDGQRLREGLALAGRRLAAAGGAGRGGAPRHRDPQRGDQRLRQGRLLGVGSRRPARPPGRARAHRRDLQRGHQRLRARGPLARGGLIMITMIIIIIIILLLLLLLLLIVILIILILIIIMIIIIVILLLLIIIMLILIII